MRNRWPRGVSGNPAGRPRGSKNKTTLAVEALLDGQGEALCQKAVEKALEGDPACLKLCLDRILPPRKDRPVVIGLPEINGATDLVAAMAELVRLVADGQITPMEGEAVGKLIRECRLVLEAGELERRIIALEDRLLEEKK